MTEAASPSPAPSHAEQLAELRAAFEEEGIDVEVLETLEIEVQVLTTPPGLLGRLRAKVSALVTEQWSHVQCEFDESGEAIELISRQVRDDQELSPAQRDRVREQVLDLMRAVPAGLFAVVNAALPIPATGLLTPFILRKAGLLPSRWREAHMLHKLQTQADELRSAGKQASADRIDALRTSIEKGAGHREQAEQQAELLSHWDINRNGQWDEDELAAYQTELLRLRQHLVEDAAENDWYFKSDGLVFGPLRISEFLDRGLELKEELLVCFAGRSGWVDLHDLAANTSEN